MNDCGIDFKHSTCPNLPLNSTVNRVRSVWFWYAGSRILLIHMIFDKSQQGTCNAFQFNWQFFWISSSCRCCYVLLAQFPSLFFPTSQTLMIGHYAHWITLLAEIGEPHWLSVVCSISGSSWSLCRYYRLTSPLNYFINVSYFRSE